MKKRREIKFYRILRAELYILCGMFGSIFALCDIFEIPYKIHGNTLWKFAAECIRERTGILKSTRILIKEIVSLIGAYYSVKAGEWTGKSCESTELALGMFVFGLIFAFLFTICVYGKRFHKAGWLLLGICSFFPFLVGSTLTFGTMVLLGICVVGFYNQNTKNAWKYDIALGIMALVSLLAGHWLLEEPITVYSENPQSIQKDIKEVLNYSKKAKGGVGSGSVGKQDEVVSGNEVQLYLRTGEMPKSDIYLKGYIGGIYSAQKWSETKLGGLEVKVNAAPEEIESAPYWKGNAWKLELEVEEVNANPAYDYFPYFSNYEDTVVSRDRYLMGKRKKEYTIEYCMPDRIFAEVTEPWERAYQEFVRENYLEVQDAVREELKEITEETSAPELEMVLQKIKRYLDRETEYTVKPGRTPYGKDSVVYFLKENKKGYCMHYASAAAVLLRLNGIPSRFVNGYAVGKGEFKWKGKIAEAKVTGQHAHAWAEYYLEGFGWVPFEATPGQGRRADCPISRQAEVITAEKKESGTQNSDKSEDEPEQKPEDKAEQKPEGESEQESEDKPKDETEQWTEDKTEDITAKNGKISKIILRMMTGIAAAVFLILFRRAVRQREKYGTDQDRSHRVRHLFYYFYEMMVYLGFPKEISPQNEEFADKMRQYFPSVSEQESQLLMDIVEKANYGCGELTDDEEGFVERIYQKIKRDGMEKISFGRKIWMFLWKNY